MTDGRTSGRMFTGPELTGRYLVLLDERDAGAGVRALREATAAQITEISSADFAGMGARAGSPAGPGPVGSGLASGAGVGLMFPELGVAVVDVAPDAAPRLRAAGRDQPALLAVEPERIVTAFAPAASLTPGYLLGYRDAVDELVDGVLDGLADGGAPAAETPPAAPAAQAALPPPQTRVWDSSATWGLQATQVISSAFTGRGVRVSVLDTGFDASHPDFADRTITMQSFISAETADDIHGHGTHCTGTACGPRDPGNPPRYGVAPEADIFIGKVLGNDGSGTDGGVLAGIAWAVGNGCRVVSMSLGAVTDVGDPFSVVYENAARRAMRRGTVLIAAAGNQSERHLNLIAPVGHPANCPSVMAVGAVGSDLEVADFSCGALEAGGGEVDIAAPGVEVHSSWPMPTRYRHLRGTSMAAPHVAGIAALFAEAKPSATAAELVDLLASSAHPLPFPARDVGAGLVQSP